MLWTLIIKLIISNDNANVNFTNTQLVLLIKFDKYFGYLQIFFVFFRCCILRM